MRIAYHNMSQSQSCCSCGQNTECTTLLDLQVANRKVRELQEQNSIAGEFGQAVQRLSLVHQTEPVYGEKCMACNDDTALVEESSTLTFMLQALLARHENYVAEAEKDRRRMMEKVSALEHNNTELEGINKRKIQENRDLLDQLEALNGVVKDSDTKVQSLSEVLSSTEYELERMTGLAARTEELHMQMTQLEEELAAANSVVTITVEESRTAALRWQDAEKTITSLQAEIERIEGDAKVERERHIEVVERMEKRKAVESELRKNRPWKLSDEGGKDGNGVVSHFVKDILQDNANLQLGIVELREMLQRSNNEIDRLRDDVISSAPNAAIPDREGAQTPSLSSELEGTREVHVHHHYHAPKSRTHLARRKGKQRGSGSSTPRSSISNGLQMPSSSSAILHNTSVTIPRRNNNRWSTQSGITTSSSSLPGSPYSESIFDRAFQDGATDISRPSTPDSVVLSPRNSHAFFRSDHNRSDSLAEIPRSKPLGETEQHAGPKTLFLADHNQTVYNSDHPIIIEENEDLDNSQYISSSPPKPFASDFRPSSPIRPMRRRANSHESLISIHGMDIHTLRTRPSQLLLGQYVSAAPSTATSQVTVTDTSAFASRPLPRARQEQKRTTSQTYLSGIAAAQKGRDSASSQSKPSLKGKVGGWVWSRWGARPTSDMTTALSGGTSDNLTTSSASSVNTKDSAPISPDVDAPAGETPAANRPFIPKSAVLPTLQSQPVPIRPSLAEPRLSDTPLTPRKMFMRPPGVNQSGPIFGFPPERRLNPVPVVKKLDVKALKDVLEQ